MKNIPTILLALFITGLSFSQPTQSKGINYKALIKDNNNNVLSNQNITIEFSILDVESEPNFAEVVYAETHTTSTDGNGIVIANIGEGVPLSGFENVYEQLQWSPLRIFGSRFLKVRIDSGSGFTDMGTTEFKAVPYALFAEQTNSSGLEQLDEGGGIGWRLIGKNPDDYGPIAVGAVDLSYSWSPSDTKGATGNYATAVGLNTTASGQSSFASGVGTIASQAQATAMGAGTVASGHTSTAMGIGTRAEAPNSTAIGLYNVGGGDPLLAASTDPLFEIGNGQYIDGTNDIRRNALTVLRNGTITAPSFDLNEITDDKALITKEYADANYSGGAGASSGLEAIDEGNGIGWRLIGRAPANYGNIGSNAIDLSTSTTTSTNTGAIGNRAFAAGYFTTASGSHSTALGFSTEATGTGATALGSQSIASGINSLASGFDPRASGTTAVALGTSTTASGDYSFASGHNSSASMESSTALGANTIANASFATALGANTTASGLYSTAFGFSTEATGNYATAFGSQSEADGAVSTACGFSSLASGDWSTAMGYNSEASGNYAFALGKDNSATMEGAVSIGTNTTASANFATALGANTTASGIVSTAMGNLTTASGLYATAMGTTTKATGDFSTAMGVGTTAHGDFSFASGYLTIGNGSYSAAFGSNTDAYGDYSVAMGLGTISDGQSSLVIGEYNDIRPDVLFQVGNGTGDGTGGTFRANAMTVFTNGHILAFSYDLPSDRRLKSNIIDLNYGLQTILKLSPVAYNWKNRPEESSKTFGLIAQDVQPIINEIVDVGEDKNKTLSINYTELIPVLIKAIQDQQSIIDNQNKKINNLSAQVEQFKDLSNRVSQLESLNNNQQ